MVARCWEIVPCFYEYCLLFTLHNAIDAVETQEAQTQVAMTKGSDLYHCFKEASSIE